MSDNGEWEPEPFPWAELIWQDEYKPKPGHSLQEAIDRLAQWEGPEHAQAVAADYLQSGIWTATCQRAFVRQGVCKLSSDGGFKRKLSSLESRQGEHQRRAAFSASYVSSSFWNAAHAKASEEWELQEGFMWPDAARIHRKRGMVEAFHGFFRDNLQDDEFFAVRLTLFGVEVSEEDVEATAPPKGEAKASIARKTAFDWEAAFADVGSRFYHDIEFPDLDARGVQTEIITLLRNSFEARGLAMPSDDTLKPKARKLLGALRSKKP